VLEGIAESENKVKRLAGVFSLEMTNECARYDEVLRCDDPVTFTTPAMTPSLGVRNTSAIRKCCKKERGPTEYITLSTESSVKGKIREWTTGAEQERKAAAKPVTATHKTSVKLVVVGK
jgi:hypothetical protein